MQRWGHKSLDNDYPLYAKEVSIGCHSADGEHVLVDGVTTDWYGTYWTRLDVNASDCQAVMSLGGNSLTYCGEEAGPSQQARLAFRINDTDVYTVDTLLGQPAQSMPFCLRSSSLASAPDPFVQDTPLVMLPKTPISACSHEMWTRPEYACHWGVAQPDTKVADVFGENAAKWYGTEMDLFQGIQGGDDYRKILLREGITALLNSYYNTQFTYPTLHVLDGMNRALRGTPQQALLMALWFEKANSGYGSSFPSCVLDPCS
ncbi:hypothetical protein IFM89_028332 [Coptis chinensis]|uniref:Uncharacterized protein n=1 Tax=Coptis chinensis TaxID=261450 RepID=A0A835I7S0_9MAGN|nr:hypothetical protein IFM89_028332 [Coptis chinensis]